MNSRERRKLEAQQHNDAIAYEKWLKDNAIYSRVEPRRKGEDKNVGIFGRVSLVMLIAQSSILGLYK